MKHVLIINSAVPVVIILFWSREYVERILGYQGQKHQLIAPKQEKLSTIIANILVT